MYAYSSTTGATKMVRCGGQYVLCDRDCVNCTNARVIYTTSSSTSNRAYQITIVETDRGE